ncbi:unknown protein [Seminavis robusta]|uniref:Uncharacterized protein n=1 Tax=Seminavis robusta TaxID=568900 RepID=A0A9N8F602_9STRA|nr:unknown protein [Seminavis robusta]|eukprot:Sro3833_g351320.1 n/a (206) ;mRNA; r:1034-1651
MPLLLLVLTVLLYPYSDASECTDCVDQGCTYCKKDDFFGDRSGPSVCVCEGLNDGFFGQNAGKGCSDFTFGASELKSKPDCTFGNQQGEIITAVVVVACLAVVAAVGLFVYKRRKSRAYHPPASTPAYESATPAYNSEPVTPTSSVLPVVRPTAPPVNSNKPVPIAAAVAVDEDSLRAQAAMTVSATPVPYTEKPSGSEQQPDQL